MAEADRAARTAAVDAYRHRLDHLRAEGRALRVALADLPHSPAGLQALGVWQRECASTVSQLSGGSKAHWLSRAFSHALLVPDAESASVVTIISRLLEVLNSAERSLADAVSPSVADLDSQTSPPARFATIKNAALRSNLEHAYLDGQAAFKRGDFAYALMTSCSILETIITDALEGHGLDRLAPHDPPTEPIVRWPFTTRIALAERAGLISRGCARLPPIAREYRDRFDAEWLDGAAVSLRDAKLTSDVLHVVLRDLSPGR